MFQNDILSQWLGMKVTKVESGSCEVQLTVRNDMSNGFGIAHGAITYALADSALAFASNSRGKQCVSVDTQISHLLPCKANDVITASVHEIQRSKTLGRYEVEIYNQDNNLVAHFRGTVFIKDEEWIID